MPVCFGISFTSTFLNQAGALVHVYTDGSVSVCTGAVEMGQGVNNKIAGIAARTLGVPAERLRMESTSTTRVANTSPTAASTGADLNGKAVELACRAIRDRLLAVAAELLGVEAGRISVAEGNVLVDGAATELAWEKLVWAAYTRRVNLSAQAHYATPDIHFDRTREKGEPFAYHVFGTAAVEVTVDCLRGTYTRRPGVGGPRRRPQPQPAGRPRPARGRHRPGHRLDDLRGAALRRRPPADRHPLHLQDPRHPMAPPEIDAVFLDDADNPHAVLNSKAVGEPPFMYGIGAYFALLDAMKAFRPEAAGLLHRAADPRARAHGAVRRRVTRF